MNPDDPTKDWADANCSIFVTLVFFGTAIYAAIDLWLIS